MTIKAFYQLPNAREIELTLPISKDTGSLREWLPETNLREVTFTLAEGQRWPNRLRKGAPIEYGIMGRTFAGKVTRRRKNVLVCWGEIQ